MRFFPYASALALLIGTAASANAQAGHNPTLVVTASNTAANKVLVYDTAGHLLQSLPTNGQGGAAQGSNAGGIMADRDQIAVINFGSKSVSIFERGWNGLALKQVVPTASSPVSVAFGHDHLYVLGTTEVESHRIFDSFVSPGADGVAGLVLADGSAAQVGVLRDQLILAEKNNAIETVNLTADGAASGTAKMVSNIPANVNTPFGLVTRGNEAYVTIAHANEISLVRNDAVLTVTGSGTQMSPCWLALDGPFMFSSNSPSLSISRYVVYGQKIVQDAAVAASLNGEPTDIAHRGEFVSVIDGSGSNSHLSTFKVDEDGNLTLNSAVTIPGAINGVAIVRDEE